jgi:predicted nucleic acid-binding protein
LGLKEGDDIVVHAAGGRSLEIEKAPSSKELLARLRRFGGRLDTSVLLYLLSANDAKADQVEALLADYGNISVQVLNEFSAVAKGKLAMSFADIREILSTGRVPCHVHPLTVETHERALEVAERYRFSIYDSPIVASALLADCRLLSSEELQHRQVIDQQLTVINPFLSP